MWQECIGGCTDVKVSGANLFILKYPLNIAVCKIDCIFRRWALDNDKGLGGKLPFS